MAEEGHGSTSLVGSAIEKLSHSIQHFLDHALAGGDSHGHGEKTFLQNWFGISSWVEYAGNKGISRGTFLTVLYLALFVAGSVLMPQLLPLIASWLFMAFPILGPVAIGIGWWRIWIWYVRSYFIFARTKPILLEVRMPTEITKSPRAMELVFTSLWFRSSMTTPIDQYWYGGVYSYYSFELVSHGGEVHFYIWSSREGYRNIIETNMYAQYPEVEIVEVEDYATAFHFDDDKHKAFVGDIVLESHDISRHDPRVNAYPIKTYVDFELDKDPKEELKVEPYAQVLEVLSTLNKDEEAWVQIVIQGHFGKQWKKLIEDEIKLLRRQSAVQPGKESAPEEDPDKYGFPRPTWREQELMKSMERNMSKLPYDFGIRMIFIGPKNNLRSPEYTAVRWLFRPFGNPNYQIYLRPRNAHNDFDWPWQDYKDHRYYHEIHRYLDAYRRRQMFWPPWEDTRNITSVEVLATLWHPPSSTIQAPGLQRIPSSKSEPPPNLPM